MDLKDKDFEFDPDLLNNIFEQLTLECIPDLSGTLDNLANELESNLVKNNNGDSAAVDAYGNDFKKNIKIENDENINFSQNIFKKVSLNEKKVPADVIKKESEDEGCHFIKSEPLTDSSSSEDEEKSDLIERGKESVKKRSHKKKVYEPKPRHSPSEFDSQKLYHGSSGIILENNSSSFQVQSNCTSKFSYSACQVKLNYNNLSPESYYVNSPDSGFGSPSPPTVSSPPPIGDSTLLYDYEAQEEKRKIQEIYDSILEEVKLYQIEESKQNSNVGESSHDDNEQIFNTGYRPLDTVKKNIAGNLKNETASLNNFIPPSEFQVPDDDDDWLDDLVDELLKSQMNQSASTTIDSNLENSESVASQNPVVCYRPVVQVESVKRKIGYNIKVNAKRALRNSEIFDVEKYRAEGRKMLKRIKYQEKQDKKIKIIDYDEREEYKNLQQTNLHVAVIESNIERVLCIIEALKCYGLDLFDINNQDVYKKTALDYAIEQKMPLLIDYLKENNAVSAIKV